MSFLLEILDKIKEGFQLSMETLQQLIYNLEQQTEIIDNLTTTIQTGTINGYDFIGFMGAFRWLVGDVIWFAFYILILTGLAFTIYNIVMFIKTKALPGGVIDKVLGWFM